MSWTKIEPISNRSSRFQAWEWEDVPGVGLRITSSRALFPFGARSSPWSNSSISWIMGNGRRSSWLVEPESALGVGCSSAMTWKIGFLPFFPVPVPLALPFPLPFPGSNWLPDAVFPSVWRDWLVGHFWYLVGGNKIWRVAFYNYVMVQWIRKMTWDNFLQKPFGLMALLVLQGKRTWVHSSSLTCCKLEKLKIMG